MRRLLAGLGLLILVLTWLPEGVGAGPSAPQPTGEFVPGEVLVRWRAGTSAKDAQAILAAEGAERIGSIEALNIDRLRVPPGEEGRVIARLQADPRVVFIEPNYIAHAASIPNDPDYWRQWNMDRISVAHAWDVAKGDPNLIVAVIDSGVDMNHPELAARLLDGWDYVRDDPVPDDEYGHGTHVAGIIGAITNNGEGVAGMSWYGWLLPYKVLDQAGRGTYADIAAAIIAAQGRGARVINLSLGGSSPSQTLQNAVDAAYGAGILLVAATGNSNGPVNYPAAYSHVMAVAATTDLDRHAWYSNRGPEVDVAAPGGLPDAAIYSTSPGGYGLLYGTSMAAAHVSGLAALIWSIAPHLTHNEVRQIIEETAEQVDGASHPYVSGRNDYLGRGRINAEMALHDALIPQIEASAEEIICMVSPDQPGVTRTVRLGNPSLQPMAWEAQVLAGSRWLSLNPPVSGSLAYPTTTPLSLSIDMTGMLPGTYVGLVRVTGTSEYSGQQLDIYVQVQMASQVQRVFLPYSLQHQG